MNSECIFCRIVAGELPSFKVYEDDHTLCFMDINPASDGHALVIPKSHSEDVHAIGDEQLAQVVMTARRVAGAIQSTLKPDGINLVQANGEGAAQSVHHFHMHVLPRTNGDNLRLNWGLVPGDMAQIEKIADRLRSAV